VTRIGSVAFMPTVSKASADGCVPYALPLRKALRIRADSLRRRPIDRPAARRYTTCMGWKARWFGGMPSKVPCVGCLLAHWWADLCAECRRCRQCAPGAWRTCDEGVPDCGPYCRECPAKHEHQRRV
jgi:hypothetical protein